MNARSAPTSLSKSRFMAGLQCHKRLYLETYQPELADLPNETSEATLAVGHAVGELARKRFPGGVLLGEETKWDQAEPESRNAIRDAAIPAIFEGAFAVRNLRIRADIVTRTKEQRFD